MTNPQIAAAKLSHMVRGQSVYFVVRTKAGRVEDVLFLHSSPREVRRPSGMTGIGVDENGVVCDLQYDPNCRMVQEECLARLNEVLKGRGVPVGSLWDQRLSVAPPPHAG